MISISSCVVSKPDSDVLIGPDYNNRYSVGNAHFDRKLSVAGGIGVAVTTGAGAYLAYQNKLIQYQDGSQTKDLKYGNAAIGALVGFGTSMIINKAILKQGTKKMPKSPQQWLNKTSNKYAFIEGNSSSFRVMNKSAENNYIVKDYHDFNDFNLAFPNSLNKEKVIAGTININLPIDDIEKIIQKYPASPSNLKLKKEYVSRSKSLSGLIEANKKYPETEVNVEELGKDLVYNMSSLQLFYREFPNSLYLKQLVEKVVPSSSFNELELFIISCPQIPKVELAKYWCVLKSPTISEMNLKNNKYNQVVEEDRLHEAAWVLVGKDLALAREFIKNFPISDYIKSYENGDIFLGVIQNGKREGYGFMIDSEDYEFRGNWNNDMRSGYGEEYYTDSDYYYKGNFEKDDYEGTGELKEGKVRFYKGEFKAGKKHGPGILSYDADNGTKATTKGNFVNGSIEGKGRIDFSNGEWYEGDFKDGLPHGTGTYRYSNGIQMTGRYKESVRIGVHNYRKYVLFGLADLNRGEVDFGEGDGKPIVTETYNIFDERREERSSMQGEGNQVHNSSGLKYEVIYGQKYCEIKAEIGESLGEFIHISDYGLLSSNVCEKDYYVRYIEADGDEYERRDPFSDMSEQLIKDEFPVTVEIVFDPDDDCNGEEIRRILVKFYSYGNYTIRIND